MTLTAHTLLDGPRGRRLLLELFEGLGGQIDPRITMPEVYGDTFPSHIAWLGGGRARRERRSATELVAAISSMPTTDITDTHVWDALTRTVDVARYWQEPDEVDRIATRGDVRDALHPLAEAVIAAAATSWWSTPMDPTQWRVEFASNADPGMSDAAQSAESRLGRWRAETVAHEGRSQRERAQRPDEPFSGEWWSTPQGMPFTTRALPAHGPVGLSVVEDGFGESSASVVQISGGQRVLELDAETLVDLCRRHPIDVTHSRHFDWLRCTGRSGPWVIPDWQAVAAEFDAVHLSVNNYLALAGRPIDIDSRNATLVAGWSPDATYWLNDIAEVGSAVRWQQQHTPTWRPR